MSAPWGRGGSLQVFWHLLLTLQTLIVTSSSSKSPLLGQEIQLTFPRQWEQMLVHHRKALWWPLCVVRCTLYPPFRLTFAPQSSYYQFVMHTGNKWGISSGGAPSLISAPIWSPIVLAQLLRAQLFCQQCASDRRHYSLLCTIFSICQTDNSCQLPKLTMTHVWPSFEYSFTHAKDKDDNAKDERKSRFLDPKEMEWLSLWLNFVSFYLKGLIPLNNEKTPISLKCQPLQVFFVFFFEVIVINQAGSSNLIT